MNSGDGNYTQYAKVDGSRGRKRKKVRKDRKSLQDAQSESQYASRRMNAGTGYLQKAYSGKEQDLPRFNRSLQSINITLLLIYRLICVDYEEIVLFEIYERLQCTVMIPAVTTFDSGCQ